MRPDFTDVRALVTGASRGLGSVAARAFADASARIVASGRDGDALDQLAAGASGRITPFARDLSGPTAVSELVAFCENQLGGLDLVIHCLGGGFGRREPLIEWEDLDLLYRMNLAVGAEINRLVVPGMKERGRGNIVHVGSVASTQSVGSVGYNSVKAALAAYVRSLGRELASTGVIVTSLLPGAFLAPGNSWVRLEERNPEAYRAYAATQLPRGRFGQAEELLPVLFLLAGPGASMMSGSNVGADAGEGRAYP